MDVLESGTGETLIRDMDDVREWMKGRNRSLDEKVMGEKEAVEKFVSDGDYVSYDLCGLIRGPMAIEREVVRQKKRNLWLSAKFTILDTEFLVGAGCVSKIDVGFGGVGGGLYRAIEAGKVKTIEWCNNTLALRHLAGAMGIPFIPTRAMLGTDTFKRSGAKVVNDPFTGKKICLIPAVNPDVALIHVHESDVYGNARVFGASVSPFETAAASKRVILCAEKIIGHENVRKNPAATTIPYFLVDAVVKAPFGSHPGTCPGLYFIDLEHVGEFLASQENPETLEKYYEKYVYSVSSHSEYLRKRVGKAKMDKLKKDEKIKEGYHA